MNEIILSLHREDVIFGLFLLLFCLIFIEVVKLKNKITVLEDTTGYLLENQIESRTKK